MLDLDKMLQRTSSSRTLLKAPVSQHVKHLQKSAKAPSNKFAGSSELAVKALVDMTAFAELIRFHGGWSNFGECHTELAEYITRPQVNESCQAAFLNEGDEYKAHLRRMVLMPRGHLKALEDTQGVLTPTGWQQHGKLKPGDFVIGSDGKPTKVTHVHPASVMPLYEVETRDGRVVKCNGEHLWQVTIPSNTHKPQVLSTNELLLRYKRERVDKRTGKSFTEYRAFIDAVAFQGTHQELPVDPYTLGAWLGDGDSSGGSFTTADEEMLKYLPYNISVRATKYRFGILSLVHALRKAGVLNNKHIPEQYYLSSYSQRLELLRGLMDTDGTCHKDGNIAYFSQSNKAFVDQFAGLVRSLGGIATVCAYESSCNGKTFPTWAVSVKLPVCPFRLKRKVAQWKGCVRELKTAIVDIRPVAPASARCITVANADGIYLTSDYLPTHNSTVGTILYVLWRIYRNPNIRILVACNLQTLAFSFVRELRSYFENPELDSVWNKRPHIDGALLPQLQKRSRDRNFSGETEAEDKKVIWNNVALQVVRSGRYKEPTVFATSVGTTVTGQHYDLVILDDLIDFRNVESETKKAQVEEWIADVESVLNPPELTFIECAGQMRLTELIGGEILVNGTRYAVDDYYAQVIEKQEELGYQCHIRNVYKNGRDNTEGYLWHEKYNDRVISSLQARLSPRRFSSQYLNAVYEKDCALFETRAITVESNESVFFADDNCYFRHSNGRVDLLQVIIAADPAFSTSKTSDDASIVVGAKLSDGSLLVIDAALDRMTATEFVSFVITFAQRYRTLRLYTEANGVGMLVPDLFAVNPAAVVDGKRVIVNSHYEQRTKESKIQGVLELPINTGRVRVCQRVRENQRIWKQMQNFPAVRHDDFLDSLVTLWERAIPARESQQRVRPTYDYALKLNQTLENNGQQQPSLLSAYSSYFG